jgi:GntR family transcriptional regulator/MocR family aminotransferase
MRTAAYFLSLGHYDALIRRTRITLNERCEVMHQAIKDNGLTVAGQGAHGGSSIWMRAPQGTDTEKLAKKLMLQGVLIEPGRTFFHGTNRPREYYRLAYSSIPTDRIPEGIRLIAESING